MKSKHRQHEVAWVVIPMGSKDFLKVKSQLMRLQHVDICFSIPIFIFLFTTFWISNVFFCMMISMKNYSFWHNFVGISLNHFMDVSIWWLWICIWVGLAYLVTLLGWLNWVLAFKYSPIFTIIIFVFNSLTYGKCTLDGTSSVWNQNQSLVMKK